MAPGFTRLYDRWKTGTLRKEDMILNIHNDKLKGSENVFSDEQLALFDSIVGKVDDFFLPDLLDCEYGISIIEPKVPIYLIPYETFLVRMKSICDSPFAKKMREKYKEEEKAIEKLQDQEERSKRLKKLKKKYGPWICEHYPCKEGCIREWHTPLGYFVPEEYAIYICLDGIIKTYPEEKVDAIAAKVILHELGHAMMYNSLHLHYDTLFEYWVEEALANKIALKYLSAASKFLKKPELFTYAKEMVLHQPDPYKFGFYAYENNALNWKTLRENKNHVNEVIGDNWVDAVCEDDIDKSYLGIQRLFYETFIGIKHTTIAKMFTKSKASLPVSPVVLDVMLRNAYDSLFEDVKNGVVTVLPVGDGTFTRQLCVTGNGYLAISRIDPTASPDITSWDTILRCKAFIYLAIAENRELCIYEISRRNGIPGNNTNHRHIANEIIRRLKSKIII